MNIRIKTALATVAFLMSSAAFAFDDFQIYGDIVRKWAALNGTAGPLGAPRSSEADASGGGRFNNFQFGYIYWRRDLGAHAVYGLIGRKWDLLGRERGLGYPTTDEARRFNGYSSEFSRNATISLRRGDREAFAVYGLIRDRWVALGREEGRCGYPLGDEFDISGGRRSNFERGFITWRRGDRQAVAACASRI